MNLYDSARKFADGAGSVDDAGLRPARSAGGPKQRPKKMQALMDVWRKASTNFAEVEDDLWKNVKQ